MWQHDDEGTHIYSIGGDAIRYYVKLIFDPVFSFFAGVPLGVYLFAFLVLFVLILYVHLGPIVATSTDKSQSDVL